MSTIQENVRGLLSSLPPAVQLVVAGKGRTVAGLMAALEAGAHIIGENYVQEAEQAFEVIGNLAQWHFIGHLQKNKVKRAVELFDLIETVDSPEIAREIEKRCLLVDKIMPVLIEVNSGREINKAGTFPEQVASLASSISSLPHLRLMGLMTMGPQVSQPEQIRPFYNLTRKVFDEVANLNLPGVQMKYLSMGMTDSYRIALEEGANLVRIGKGIFGTP